MGLPKALLKVRGQAEKKKAVAALDGVRRVREGFFFTHCPKEDLNPTTVRARFFKEFPEAHIVQAREWGVFLEARFPERVPLPPEGYAYKGGAARLVLEESLEHSSSRLAARDLDLVRVSNAEDHIDKEIATKIMKEDAKFGSGVEMIGSFEEYFRTRDIVINEILCCRDRVVASYDAIKDLTDKRLRPTPYALSQSQSNQEIISAKIVRLFAEQKLRGNKWKERDCPTKSPLSLFPFFLHLERALEQNSKLGEFYCEECSKLGLTPNELGSVRKLQELSLALTKIDQKIYKKFPNIRSLVQKKEKVTKRKVSPFRN